MQRAESYAALAPLLSAQLRRGVVTNCFLSAEDYQRELPRGLYYEEREGCLLLLRQRPGHLILNFYLQPGGTFFLPDVKKPVVNELSCQVFARFDRDIAQNRGVIGDLLQTVLDLRRLLGIQLVGLVIGFDRRIECAFLDLLQLLPCHDLPVALVGDEIGIVPCNGFRTVERHLLGARGIAHRKFQQRRLHRSEQVGRRFRCGVVIDPAAIDPRGGLGVLLGIRDVGIALLEFGQRRLLIHFLRFGSRNGQQRSGCGHQNESFHTRFN